MSFDCEADKKHGYDSVLNGDPAPQLDFSGCWPMI